MKKVSLSALLVLSGCVAFSQSLESAIKKTNNEQLDAATSEFLSLIKTSSDKGELYFYLGENYFKKEMLDSAEYYYKMGIGKNPTYPLNYAGYGKILWYAGKYDDAKAQFFKAISIAQNKNAEVFRKIAEAYINAPYKNLDEAIDLLNKAIKLEPKSAMNYILLGDAYLEKNPADGTPAIKQYNEAIRLNPQSATGTLRIGKLYERARNYTLALEHYKKAIEIEPNFAPAYRELAELYHKANMDNKAIEMYAKYLQLNNSTEARYRYASFLFEKGSYEDAIKEMENLRTQGFDNAYVNRILAYSYYELGDKKDKDAYAKGLNYIQSFFEKAGDGFKYLASDYKYKGLLMMKVGKDSLGLLELERAIKMDSSIADDLNKEIGKAYLKNKRYEMASAYFDKVNPSKMSSQDWFEAGRAYYYAKQFDKADTAFGNVLAKLPNFDVTYVWKARVKANLDPKNEKWLALPYYDKYFSLVKPEERSNAAKKSNVIEACEYLGYYYMTQKNKDKATEYFTIIKELDPNNLKAQAFFKQGQKGGK
ncbi:MAG: tetratricopeptide repeat protein [Bacteroidetes bacterium]|nr:MAG: tetratricopeptide repeat protein [Bacteroidota bacterium]